MGCITSKQREFADCGVQCDEHSSNKENSKSPQTAIFRPFGCKRSGFNQIDVIAQFWNENISPLQQKRNEDEYLYLCELLYTNIFKQLPFTTKLFSSSNKVQGDRFFQMLSELVSTLIR
eukprot:313833_1